MPPGGLGRPEVRALDAEPLEMAVREAALIVNKALPPHLGQIGGEDSTDLRVEGFRLVLKSVLERKAEEEGAP